MSNFFRRTLAFILGMIFTVVVTVGALAGGFYWAFKNMSLNGMGAGQEILGGLNDATLEDWLAIIQDSNSSGTGVTFKSLEKYGFDTDTFVANLGINTELADSEDVEMIKNISLSELLGENALDEIKMGAMFAFIPKNAETNKYPVFSKSARGALRNYSLGEMFAVDSYTGQPRIWSVISSMKFASIYSEPFEETYNSTKKEYEYTSQNSSLELLGNLEFSLVTNAVVFGEAFDVGKELNEGSLVDVGSQKINEFIANLVGGESGSQIQQYLSILDKDLKSLFKLNEDTGVYEFDYTVLLQDLTIGKLMNVTYNEELDVWQDSQGNEIVPKTLEEEIMLGMYKLGIDEIIGGVESNTIFSTLLNGAYFGSALGNVKSQNVPSGFCSATCKIEYESDGETPHEHVYYWVDDEGNYVGELFNIISNKKISDALSGDLDLIGDINSVKIGEILGYQLCTQNADCQVHSSQEHCTGLWYNGYYPISKEDSMSKLLYNIYGYSLNDIKNGSMSMDGIVDGILLGDLLSHTRIDPPSDASDEYCKLDCNKDHSHVYYWIDSAQTHLEKIDEQLANISLKELVSGNFEISEIFGDVYVGDLMGYTLVEGKDGYCDKECTTDHDHKYYWQDSNGQVTGANSSLANLSLEDLLKGNFDITGLLDDMYVGELMGYTLVEGKGGYCDKDCTTDHEHEHYWENSSSVQVTGINGVLADLTVSDLTSENVDFTHILGDLQVGAIIGYEKCSNDLTCEIHSGEQSHDGWWYFKNNLNEYQKVSTLNNRIANETVNDLNGGHDFADIIGDMYVGELMNYKKAEKQGYCSPNCTDVHEKHTYYWVDGNGGIVSKLNNSLANISLQKITSGNLTFADFVGDMFVGEMLENYKHCSGDSNCELHQNCKNERGWYEKQSNGTYEKVSVLDQTIADIKLLNLINGSVNFKDVVGTLLIGDIMGYKLCTGDSDCELHEDCSNQAGWYEKKSGGEFQKVSKLNQTIADNTLGAIINGTSFSDMVGDLYIGDIMNYIQIDAPNGETGYCSPNCSVDHEHSFYWIDGSSQKVSKVDSIVANFKLFALMNGSIDVSSKLQTLTLSDIITINDESPMILKTLKDAKINGLSNAIDEIKLGDCIDMTTAPSILKALEGTKVNSLASEMKVLHIGDVMGYTKQDDGSWHDKNNNLVTGINAKLANKSLQDIEDNGFDSSEFVLSDVITNWDSADNKIFTLMELKIDDDSYYSNAGEVPVTELAQRMNNGVKGARYSELEVCGIISLDDATKEKLDGLFLYKYYESNPTKLEEAKAYWRGLNMNDLLKEIISSIPTT